MTTSRPETNLLNHLKAKPLKNSQKGPNVFYTKKSFLTRGLLFQMYQTAAAAAAVAVQHYQEQYRNQFHGCPNRCRRRPHRRRHCRCSLWGQRHLFFSGLGQLMVMRWEVAMMAVAASVLCDGSGSTACWRRRIATAAVGEGRRRQLEGVGWCGSRCWQCAGRVNGRIHAR